MKEPTGKRQQRTQKNRDAILSAAHTLFSESGYDRTTMADIQRETGLTIGSIYHLFQNKFDILRAVYQQHTCQVEPLTEGMEGKLNDPVGQILSFVSQFEAQWMAAGRGIGTAIYQYHMAQGFQKKETPNAADPLLPEALDIRGELLCYLTALAQAGRLQKDISPETAADCILLFARGLILSWSFSREDYDLAAQTAPLWQAFLPAFFLP